MIEKQKLKNELKQIKLAKESGEFQKNIECENLLSEIDILKASPFF